LQLYMDFVFGKFACRGV